MFPRYFTYNQVPNAVISASPSMVPISLINLLPNALETDGNCAQTNALSSYIMHINSALNRDTVGEEKPHFDETLQLNPNNMLAAVGQSLGIIPPYIFPNQLAPFASATSSSLNQFDLNRIVPFFNSQNNQRSTTVSSTLQPTVEANNVDSHTIVRAPVLYKTAAQSREDSMAVKDVDSSTSCKTTKRAADRPSPPDQIVASYAVAARAAAIACQQPLSNAAEVFLSAATPSLTNGTGKLRSRRPRNRLTVAKTSMETPITSLLLKLPQTTTTTTNTGDITKHKTAPMSWNSSWNRIVDRQANIVVYISPDGARFTSLNELKMLFENCKDEKVFPSDEDFLNKNFCFDASKDTRLVQAPDDTLIGPLMEKIKSSASQQLDASINSNGKRSATINRICSNSNVSISQLETSPKHRKVLPNPQPSNTTNNVNIDFITTNVSSKSITTGMLTVAEQVAQIENSSLYEPTNESLNSVPQTDDQFFLASLGRPFSTSVLSKTLPTFVNQTALPSVLPPVSISSDNSCNQQTTLSTQMHMNLPSQVNDISDYLSSAIMTHQQQQQHYNNSLAQLIQQHQVRLGTSVAVNGPVGVNFVPGTWPFFSEELSVEDQSSLLQQQYSAVVDYQRNQQALAAAALLLQTHHQQQQQVQAAQQLQFQQQVQAYAAVIQSLAQCNPPS